MLIRLLLAACALCVSGGLSYARPRSTAAQKPQIMAIKGTCDRFILGRGDDSEHCKGLVMQTVNNGFVDFVFTTPSAVLTFSGRGQQVKPNDDTAIQPVDHVILNFQGSRESMTAVGACRYTNPYAGKATVECQANLDNGKEAAAHFISDGNPPDKLQ